MPSEYRRLSRHFSLVFLPMGGEACWPMFIRVFVGKVSLRDESGRPGDDSLLEQGRAH